MADNTFYSAFTNAEFPEQKVSSAEKQKAEWYANCIDYVIAAGYAARGSRDIDLRLRILHGEMPDEFYKKTLNPYNATKDKWTKFPATLRNYDIMNGIIRRYVGEYIKNPHDFIVSAGDATTVMRKNQRLMQELRPIIEAKIAEKIQQAAQQAVEQGQDLSNTNPQDLVDIEAFVKEFNENYIDEESVQGQNLLNIVRDTTKDVLFYSQAYFDFISLGECYTVTEIHGDKLIKKVVDPGDAYPVPNDNFFVEDYDMFAERRRMTYQQIMDMFDSVLNENEKKFLKSYYAKYSYSGDDSGLLTWDAYRNYFVDICDKFPKKEREFFQRNPIRMRDLNGNLIDVWFVTWRGMVKKGIVTRQVNGFITEDIVDDTYTITPELGDISLEWIWEPQVYEGVRIGGRYNAVYPVKCRPVPYNRNGKLPYNGLMEVLPRFGKFSIIDIVSPYQVFRNILYYHREMVIATNRLNILLIAKSLLGKVPDETIYRMISSGILFIDDEDDTSMLRTQQIRMLTSSNNDYIVQLTQLIESVEQEALNQVDMTAQRYGEISNSAGKGVTDEAIMRGSMGSVVIEYVFDMMRECDYARDMDFSKLAWIDGLQTTYKDDDNNIRYLSLDVNAHIYADYVIRAKISPKEKEKLDQIKQFAFSAAQNGNMDMAIASIAGDNVAAIKKLIMQYQNVAREHETQMEQMKQQTEQMIQQFELQKIQAKGEQDRQTLELEKYLDGQIEMLKANANIISYNQGAESGLDEQYKVAAEERMNQAANALKAREIDIKAQEVAANAALKQQEIAAKIYDSNIKLKVAKENKNRYDRPKSSSSSSSKK